MSDVSDHAHDAEQVLAAFEQREGMRSPAAYEQPDNTNTAMELESSSSQVFQLWGAGGPPIDMCQHTTNPAVFTASDTLAASQQASADLASPAPSNQHWIMCRWTLQDHCMGTSRTPQGHQPWIFR